MPRPRRSAPKPMRRAAELRKEMTPQELVLWSALKGKQLGVKFRSQHAIGPYITDFCCIKAKLIIEVDGSQHLDQAAYVKNAPPTSSRVAIVSSAFGTIRSRKT